MRPKTCAQCGAALLWQPGKETGDYLFVCSSPDCPNCGEWEDSEVKTLLAQPRYDALNAVIGRMRQVRAERPDVLMDEQDTEKARLDQVRAEKMKAAFSWRANKPGDTPMKIDFEDGYASAATDLEVACNEHVAKGDPATGAIFAIAAGLYSIALELKAKRADD